MYGPNDLASLHGNHTGVLTLKGTVDEVNWALQSIIFQPWRGFAGTATLSMTTTDPNQRGGPAKNVVHFRVTNLTPYPLRPEVFHFGYLGPDYAQTVSFHCVPTNFFGDNDGDNLKLELVSRPSVGTLRFSSFQGGFAFVYQAPQGFRGTVSVVMRATDGLSVSKPNSVALVFA